MAENILKLKVDSTEYDGKIKRAQQGLQALEQSVRKAGRTFEFAEKEDLEFIKALGKMETASRTVKGKISELTDAFQNLSAQYNRLSEAEKQSPFGRAMAKSLNEMKARINDSKTELSNINKEIQGNSGALDALASKYGISIDKLKVFGIATAAASTALKVAKDAFFKNEGTLDEWGRTVESAKTTYEGFLVSLNNGDFSGFLTRIGSIVTAARNAYDALDELATFNAFNQVNVEKGKYEFQESIVNFKEGTGSKEDVEKAAQYLKDQLETRRTKEQEAYEGALQEYAARDGVDYESLKKVMTGEYGDYNALKKLGLTGVKSEWKTTMYGMPYEVKSSQAANEEERMGQMLRQLNDTELKNLQALGAQAQRTAQEMEQINRQVLRYTNETTKGGGGSKTGPSDEELWRKGVLSTDSIKNLQVGLAAANKDVLEAADAETRAHAQNTVRIIQEEIERLKTGTSGTFSSFLPTKTQLGGVDMSGLQLDPRGLKYAEAQNEEIKNKKTNEREGGKELKEGLSGITSGLKSLGVDFGEGFNEVFDKVQGVIAIIQGIQTIVNAVQLFNTANGTAQTALLSDIAANTTASAANSFSGWIPFFANGGQIPRAANGYGYNGLIGGNSYSGDNQLIAVNAGEYVFNRAQLGNLASQLQASAEKTQIIKVEIENNKLVGTLNNADKRGAYTA